MIELIHLTKEFKKPIRGNGLSGMIKTLFSRKYEVIEAVKDVSFTINEGEIVGYIGSNGAGKSTTIKMMCGILTPTKGKVLIDGVEPYLKRKQVAPKIGVVFGQKTQLWWDIPLIESFKVLKEIYQISDEDYEERLHFLFEVLSIDKFLSQPVRTLSLGQRMRADLAASLLHNPQILFLDEPTIGLDVLAKQKIREAIKLMNAKYKTTVILTTHDMNDIEDLCSSVVMIEKGSIIYDGPLINIKHKFGNIKTLVLSVDPQLNLDDVAKFKGNIEIKKEEDRVEIRFDADKVKLENVINYAFATLKATDMKVNDISIETVVKKILSEQEKSK